jgi:P pilus assembly chaperone PapD
MRVWALGLAVMTLVALWGAPRPAHAQLVADRLIVDFERGAPIRQDILIRNESKDKYYITVTPSEVINPGEDTSTKVTKTDPQELGLLVTPNRLILEPGASRSIRVVSLNDQLTRDRIYRVLIAPQVGDLRPDAAPPGQKAVALKILTAYEALVIARPADDTGKLVGQRSADGLTLKNVGNSNVLIYDGSACPVSPPGGAKLPCTKLPARRMYAGNQWHVPLPHPTDLATFQLRMTTSRDPETVQY